MPAHDQGNRPDSSILDARIAALEIASHFLGEAVLPFLDAAERVVLQCRSMGWYTSGTREAGDILAACYEVAGCDPACPI